MDKVFLLQQSCRKQNNSVTLQTFLKSKLWQIPEQEKQQKLLKDCM